MRWNKRKHGKIRKRRGFIWFPIETDDEWVWLEPYIITYQWVTMKGLNEDAIREAEDKAKEGGFPMATTHYTGSYWRVVSRNIGWAKHETNRV